MERIGHAVFVERLARRLQRLDGFVMMVGGAVAPAGKAGDMARKRRAHMEQVHLQRTIVHVPAHHMPHRVQGIGRTIDGNQHFEHGCTSFGWARIRSRRNGHG
jgi:hypothetical protein